QGERRGRATHERGGDGARIRAEGVAEEGEHRHRGEGDEPAPARRHGRAALPRASGWAPSGAASVLRSSWAFAAPSWGGRYSSEGWAGIVLAWKAPSAPTGPSTTAPRPSPNRSGGRPRKRTGTDTLPSVRAKRRSRVAGSIWSEPWTTMPPSR